eukprot:TRINITY_DN30263_c0_g1_i1.p1 TRINITY_DN30263_c0_g1~~TRINITY_DN30263_c0_g1_i1.p1  ORF type:complete len:110 (-),score=18.92 TRINITY_DN30263_c0_g1_i1:270-599(-)
METIGIHKLIHGSIMTCAVTDDCITLRTNIGLVGGNTSFKGLKERLEIELHSLMADSAGRKINVPAVEQGKFADWVGGSLLASLPTFKSMWIAAEEFYESGSGIVHLKC